MTTPTAEAGDLLAEARRRVAAGDRVTARALYETRLETAADSDRASVLNDLAVLDASDGDVESALARLGEAVALDPANEDAVRNLARLEKRVRRSATTSSERLADDEPLVGRVRVAILSLFYNWPSTGGGNVHTTELATFLARAGYEVEHWYARHDDWEIGRVEEGASPFPSEAITFQTNEWTRETIKSRYREVVDRFSPDVVIVTDSWNFKPHLADAVRGYPYLLRMQARECLCPLNNLGLLPGPTQCPNTQLADAARCRACLAEHASTSGGLHALDRQLSGVGTDEYDALLRRVVRESRGVLTLNEETAADFERHADSVVVVPWGMNPSRFVGELASVESGEGPVRFLFAGLVRESIKGYSVLREAGRRLWERRQDFEFVVTDAVDVPTEPFERFVGWKSQGELPDWFRRTDATVVPTVAREGLSRTAAEAMACGRPVVGSRLGGLVGQIDDGIEGRLVVPGDPDVLAAAIEELIDDPGKRVAMGEAGRRRFEATWRWPDVVRRHYVPRLGTESRERRLARAFERATSSEGQMTPTQYVRVLTEIQRRAPGNVLLFGAGRDTELWALANHGGRTVVVEDDPEWLERLEGCEVVRVQYETVIRDGFREDGPRLDGVPPEFFQTTWDVIVVDGPVGYAEHLPGRQQSIDTARRLAGPTTTVFLHDAQRRHESVCAGRLLGRAVERIGDEPALDVFTFRDRAQETK